MAASKYFREKLSPVVSPTAAKICLKGISVVELANLVKYIYTGKLLVARDTMDITLEISEILGLNGVIQGYSDIVTAESMMEKSGVPEKLGTMPGQEAELAGSPLKMGTSNPNAAGIAETSVNSSPVKGLKTNASPQKVPAPNQSTSTEYSFEVNPYEQQYVNVKVGSKTPTKASSQNQSSPVDSLPKMKSLNDMQEEKILAEQAQHQDLLAVAIETLTDGSSSLTNRLKQTGEVENAVSSIATEGTPAEDVIQNVEEEVDTSDFVNGKTSTRTVTLNAGVVENEWGGQTKVYTVSLDPASLKAPIQMPRQMRKRTEKEKQAEETAKKYRRKKNELLHTEAQNLLVAGSGQLNDDGVSDTIIGSAPKGSDNQQDFRFASLSKLRKKTLQFELDGTLSSNQEIGLELECEDIVTENALVFPIESHDSLDDERTFQSCQEQIVSSSTDIANEEFSNSLRTDDDAKSCATKRKRRTPKKLEGLETQEYSKKSKSSQVDSDSGSNTKDTFGPRKEADDPLNMRPEVRLKKHTDSEFTEMIEKIKEDGAKAYKNVKIKEEKQSADDDTLLTDAMQDMNNQLKHGQGPRIRSARIKRTAVSNKSHTQQSGQPNLKSSQEKEIVVEKQTKKVIDAKDGKKQVSIMVQSADPEVTDSIVEGLTTLKMKFSQTNKKTGAAETRSQSSGEVVVETVNTSGPGSMETEVQCAEMACGTDDLADDDQLLCHVEVTNY